MHHLCNLGLGPDEDEVGSSEEARPLDGSEKLGDLLEWSWNNSDLSEGRRDLEAAGLSLYFFLKKWALNGS